MRIVRIFYETQVNMNRIWTEHMWRSFILFSFDHLAISYDDTPVPYVYGGAFCKIIKTDTWSNPPP